MWLQEQYHLSHADSRGTVFTSCVLSFPAELSWVEARFEHTVKGDAMFYST